MSVDYLITELQQRNLLSEPMLDKLREAVADPARPLSARALARFLVQKEHLSQLQATNVIHALLTAGVDVDATGPPSTLISTVKPAVISASELDSSDPEEDEGSSIFPFMPPEKQGPTSPPPRPSEEDDELTLVAIEEDEAAATSSANGNSHSSEDLPVVGLLVPDEDRPRSREEPEAELPWTIHAPENSRQMSIAEMDARIKPAPFDDEEKPAARPAAARLPSDGKDARKKAGLRKKKDWDSPLILYGGGGLALMLLIGAAVLWILNWEKGDQELSQARQALDSGAYAQAIEHYEHFLENSPRHPERSQARVQLAMARIRQATEAGNFAQALELAPQELEAVEDEEDFDEAHGELASLLPQIATGLARQAEAVAAGDEKAVPLVAQAKTALELCNNVLYIPKTLRDEGQLNVVRELLRRVEHREQSHQDLQQTLSAMDKAITAGDTAAAFAAHKRLVKERLEMTGNAQLAEMIQKATAAETAAVKFVREEQAAETTERPSPWIASLALAQRRGQAAAAGTSTAVACVRVEGAVYGLDVATGKLRWRRYVGFDPTAWPKPVDQDVLVSDPRHDELVRLHAATGKLVWRQAIGEPFGEPLVVGQQAFVAAQSGRLFVIDLSSGARAGYLQFPQPLASPPAVDRRGERLYLAATQFSLYSISLADLKCLGAYYLGHEPTSIRFPPALVLSKLAVVESDGVETSRLRLLSLDDRGAVAGQETERRLAGVPASPLLAEGRRLIVATDRGQFDVYEVTSETGDAALAELATREATDAQPIVRYIAVADGHIWVADTRLTKHAILPTGNRLPVESILHNFAGDAFDHPLQLFGETLIHVRRPKGRAGVVVGATDTSQGRTLWDTDLAVPPASAPVVDASGRALVVANANGYVFRFDEAAIRSRVQDQPLAASSMPAAPKPLTAGIDLGGGRATFFAAGADQLLLYRPAEPETAVEWIKLPSPLACAATPLGDGFLAPLEVGQVFYLNPATGQQLAAPFQPKLQPRSTVHYQPAAAVGPTDARFVITDGQEKIYLVEVVDEPRPHLESVAEAEVSPNRITSPIAVLGDLAIAATENGRIVRYKLPQLELLGEVNLPAEAVWGPFRVGELLLLATADEQLVAVSASGDVVWSTPRKHGDLAGPPIATNGGILLAYRNGLVERRDAATGQPLAERDFEQPLAAGPVPFVGRLVLAAQDGTLLVVDRP